MQKNIKSMSKSELAEAAGVSIRTFQRWLSGQRPQLQAMGVSPRAHLIPPHAVRYICQQYGIEL